MPLAPGSRFLVFALALLALLAIPSAASPAGQISIFGAEGGAAVTLSSDGGNLIVAGPMAGYHPRGCHLRADRSGAVCRLAGASSIELTMGPGGDLVHVADPLPVPLTVHLGAGSDKFVGNDEPDTCYSEGARRNRCIGGGGNDICITGDKNSDCVGGAGNDYCRTSDGSDGCWGGPGDDVCYMGPGEDGCHGDAGNDRLYGGANPDQLYGGLGYDYCDGGAGLGKSHACNTGPRH